MSGNGCVRALPLDAPAGQANVSSVTPCGVASPIAHDGPDVLWPNRSSRGWGWVYGPQDFWVAPGASAIYVIDTYNNRVVVAHAPDFAAFATVAGSGELGTRDGPALSASFLQPHGLSVAPRSGRVYVADSYASCIRAVDGDEVRTVAG